MIISDFNISFLVELLLEGLPISSSGHLQLMNYFWPSVKPLPFFYAHLSHVFIFFIQIIYIFPFFKFLIYRKKWRILFHIIINFISITMLTTIGFLAKHLIIEKMFPSLVFPLPLGFFISTIFLLSIYFINRSRSRIYYTLSFRESIFLGLWQCIAFLPGVSRLATMILGAQICKFTRRHALFIAITSNAAISGGSLLYLIYYQYNIEKIIFTFSSVLILKLILSLVISALLFFLFIYLFNKNKIIVFILYELCIFLISYYIY
jgi:undecaprenyl-diphosphatase